MRATQTAPTPQEKPSGPQPMLHGSPHGSCWYVQRPPVHVACPPQHESGTSQT